MGITMKKNQLAREMSDRMGNRAERQERARLIKQAEDALPKRTQRVNWHSQDRTVVETEYVNGHPIRVKRALSNEELRRRQRKFRRQQSATSALAAIIGGSALAFSAIVLFLFIFGVKLAGLAMVVWGIWDMVQHHSADNGWAWFWIVVGLVIFFTAKVKITFSK